jgi:hypothetical protein
MNQMLNRIDGMERRDANTGMMYTPIADVNAT